MSERAVMKLQDWAVVRPPYAAPEQARIRIRGRIYGDPTRPDGREVITSGVIGASGRIVTTRGGSRYRLGRIERGYRRWLRQNNIAYDPRAPVRMIHD